MFFCSGQSSLFTDWPGSLVGGVLSCEELPNEESCFSWSLFLLGLRLKNFFSLSVRLVLPGLGSVGDVWLEVVLDSVGSSIISFC
jgi:hypothetical protein